MTEGLLIVGASTRAAAFSALRGGLHPRCIDLFADEDLQRRCIVAPLTARYPDGFLPFIESDLLGPWMYTGGLENWPRLVQRMAQRRRLWGNAETILARARDAEHVTALLQAAGMPAPAMRPRGEKRGASVRWLVKPRRGAGGSGIRFETDEDLPTTSSYFQEYIEGTPCSLLYLGDGRQAHLLGMTRQLVGTSWLHAAAFHYCGSIGPLDPNAVKQPALATLGHLLASGCGLRGLFGVDGIVREGVFWPVEINPRYTASVEVLEYATASPMLNGHAHVFAHDRLPAVPPALPREGAIGKAILFARADLLFPADGPWMAELRSPKPLDELPAFADIPAAGERIEAGRPILTFFARAGSYSNCEETLRRIAADLDRWLFER